MSLIGVLVALVGTGAASITDLRTGYVPDKLTHAMIAIGIVLVLIDNSISQIAFTFAIAGAVFAAGFLLYIFGQMGGGDVKLFTAIALLVPQYPAEISKWVAEVLPIKPAVPGYPFIVSVFLLAGIFFMCVIPPFFLKKIWSGREKIRDFRKKLLYGIACSAFVVPVGIAWSFFSTSILFLLIPILFAMMLMPFKDDVVGLFFAQKKAVEKLNDDDVIALELLDEKTKRKLGLWRKTLLPNELEKIKALAKKNSITEIFVCENMPKFVPYIFGALVTSLLVGDALFFLVASAMT